MTDMKAIKADALDRLNAFRWRWLDRPLPLRDAFGHFECAWEALVQAVTELHIVLDREADTQRRHDAKLAEMEAEREAAFKAGLEAAEHIARSHRSRWSSAGGFGGHSAAARIIADAINEHRENRHD